MQNRIILTSAGRAAGSFVSGGCTAIYDGIVGPWSLPVFTQATGLHQLHYAVLLPTLQQCLHRVATRQGHGFQDPAAAAHMHAQFTQAAIPSRHVLTDMPERPSDVANVLLQRFTDGSLLYPRP